MSKFIMICMRNHLNVTRWQELFFHTILLIFRNHCFEIYNRKFTSYLILICSFSSCEQFPKWIFFQVYRKLNMWSTIAKGPRWLSCVQCANIWVTFLFSGLGEPIRPIDTSAWVQHTTAMARKYFKVTSEIEIFMCMSKVRVKWHEKSPAYNFLMVLFSTEF